MSDNEYHVEATFDIDLECLADALRPYLFQMKGNKDCGHDGLLSCRGCGMAWATGFKVQPPPAPEKCSHCIGVLEKHQLEHWDRCVCKCHKPAEAGRCECPCDHSTGCSVCHASERAVGEKILLIKKNWWTKNTDELDGQLRELVNLARKPI